MEFPWAVGSWQKSGRERSRALSGIPGTHRVGGGIVVCEHGVAALHDTEAVASHMAGRAVEISCSLGMGSGEGAVLATDLGHGYIDENRTTS